MNRTGSSMFVSVLFVLLIAIGLGILGFGLRSLWKSHQVVSWPTTWGSLTEREFLEESDSDGTSYRVRLKYVYRVAGQDYASDRLAFGYGGSSGYDMHRGIYEKLMRGDNVRVHYNPKRPEEAVLIGGLNHSTLTLLIFGAVWTIFSCGLFVLIQIMSRADTRMLERLWVQ
jgi:Protein of unknown function (DUF3592)